MGLLTNVSHVCLTCHARTCMLRVSKSDMCVLLQSVQAFVH